VVIDNKHSNRDWSMTYLPGECSCSYRRADSVCRFNVGRVTCTEDTPCLAVHQRVRAASPVQGLTLVHSSAQPKPFWSHLTVSPCLIDWGKLMHPTYHTK